MNVFIVAAHPEPKSFNVAMRDQAADFFRAAGHEVAVSDLYAMNFNPVAGAADFGERRDPDYLVYALEQRHGVETGTIAPDIARELEKLLWCDVLFLNFPVFWFSTPAILKGWIDRVLVSGRTYGGMRFYENGGLAGKQALVSISLGGRPHMFGEKAIHGRLEDMLRHLLRGTLHYVGFEVMPPFVAWHVPYISDEERGAILRDHRDWLARAHSLEPLRFPRMDEFDERLYPKG